MSLTAERARGLLVYDPGTGHLTSKVRRGRFPAGHEAGCAARFYRVVRVDNVLYCAHRLIVLLVTGDWPESEVDHVDGNGFNNRWSNLRCVPREINAKNAKLSAKNTSKHQGVVWDKRNKKWRAQIGVDCKNIHIGRFTNKEDAIAARKAAEKTYGFHENHGRS